MVHFYRPGDGAQLARCRVSPAVDRARKSRRISCCYNRTRTNYLVHGAISLSNRTLSKATRVVPALVARTQFGQLLRRVKQNQERFVIDRRGEPQAVILSIEEYLQRFAAHPSATLAAIRRESSRRGLDKLSLRQINQVIGSVRRQRRRATR